MSLAASNAELQLLLKGNADPKTVKASLQKAKIALLQNNLLILNDASVQSPDLPVARTILELSAILSVRIRDTTAFERYLSQLQPFWAVLPASDHRSALTGLHLLLLLSRNEIGSYHTEIERLVSSPDAQEAALVQHPWVQFVTELETWLMEGSFSKIWQARNSPPVEEYRPFLDDLMQTVRSEIASCGEKAYSSLPLADAATLLFFSQRKDLMAFAAQRPGWVVNPTSQIISFEGAKVPTSDKNPVAKEAAISSMLYYASQLQQIV